MSSTLTIDQLVTLRPIVTAEPPQWSPDGSLITFISGLAGGPELWSVSPDGGFPTRLTVEMGGARFLGSQNPRWSPDGKWIAYISEKTGAAEVWLWERASGVSTQLTRLGANISGMSWSPDSSMIVVSSSRRGVFDIYTTRVATGETKRLTNDAFYSVYPAFTPDGQHIIFVRLNDAWTDHDVTLMSLDGNERRVIARDQDMFDYHFGQTFGYPLVSPDGATVVFRSYRNGYFNYWRVSINGGEPQPLAPENADQSDATWSPDGSRLAYISNHNGTLSLRVFDVKSGASQTLVAPTSGACTAPQWSPDGSRIAYLFQSPTAPLDVWIVSTKDGATHQLTNAMPGGNVASRLLSPEKIAYKTFNGLDIHAYLYKPPAMQPGKKYPAIVWTHGGPSSQWMDAFYANVQFFAQNGYVVLLPNVRGGTGYGKQFEALNNQDFGYGDLQDVIAGVNYLKSLDFVDAQKFATTGTSYGGYMTAAAVCFAPGVFQAAIAASGYPDRVAMAQEQELRHIKQMEYKFGKFTEHPEIYRKCSPIYWAHQATTPTFVLNGEGQLPRSDASRNFAQALEKEYKTVQYKAYPNEGYYVQSIPGTRQMWLDMLAFLEKYLNG